MKDDIFSFSTLQLLGIDELHIWIQTKHKIVQPTQTPYVLSDCLSVGKQSQCVVQATPTWNGDLLPPKLQRRGLVFEGKLVTVERV